MNGRALKSGFKRSRVGRARFAWSPDLVRCVLETIGSGDGPQQEWLRQAAGAVKSLSDTFLQPDGSPEAVPVYGADPLLRPAYAAYYLLANVPKIVETLESAPPDWSGIRRVVDLGTGPGTAVVGMLIARERAGIRTPVSITGIDYSTDFLSLAQSIVKTFRNCLGIGGPDRFLIRDLNGVPGSLQPAGIGEPADLLMAANVMAELSDAAVSAFPDLLETHLRPGGHALLLEPAQRRPARRLLEVRNRLGASGWSILFPCPGPFPCPALERKRDWCHHRLEWDPPKPVSEIDRITGMHKHLLNFTGLLFGKPGTDPSLQKITPDLKAPHPGLRPADSAEGGPECRIVSEILARKGRYEAFVCGDFGAGPHLLLAVLEKKRINDYNESFLELARYDRVRIDGAVIRGGRLVLSEDSRLTRRG